MRNQLELDGTVVALSDAMRAAWSTFVDYSQALMSRPSDPEYYEEQLADQIRSLYVHVAFTLEAIGLSSLLVQFREDFEPFRKDPTALATDRLGEPYPRALVYLKDYVHALRAAAGKPEDAVDGLQQLERILLGTPKVIRDRDIEPYNESSVRKAMYELLLHPYPDTVRDVPIAKVSKSYKPDIGIRSLKAAVEYKFVDSEKEAKTAIGGVYEDVKGYAGSADWQHFYAVFYMTAAYLTPAQVEAEFRLSEVDRSWKPLLVSGGGGRTREFKKRMRPPAHDGAGRRR
jgi:hypothetical protein